TRRIIRYARAGNRSRKSASRSCEGDSQLKLSRRGVLGRLGAALIAPFAASVTAVPPVAEAALPFVPDRILQDPVYFIATERYGFQYTDPRVLFCSMAENEDLALKDRCEDWPTFHIEEAPE